MELLALALLGLAFLVNLVLAFTLPLMAPNVMLTILGYLVFATALSWGFGAFAVIVVFATPIILGLIGAGWDMALVTYPAVAAGAFLYWLGNSAESDWPVM